MDKKILICWTDISGYMSACWKAFSKQKGVDIRIIAFSRSSETSFSKNLIQGLTVTFVDRNPPENSINDIAGDFNPDIIVLCGWFIPAYRKLPYRKDFSSVKFILAMDTPWLGSLRQKIGVNLLKGFVKRMHAVVTSGERSYQYASRLGADKIFKFQYGVDVKNFNQALERRKLKEWPKKFLFVGRYSEEKGIEVLIDSFKTYRKSVVEPWELHTCGQGPLKNRLETPGVIDHGFVQPDKMSDIWASAGCLVLPSSFDPWPLIVVEACAAGLPVVVTHNSGSQVEVVKMYYNGLVINGDSKEDLLEAMLWMHEHYHNLEEMGKNSSLQAFPYGAELWARKWLWMIQAIMNQDRPS